MGRWKHLLNWKDFTERSFPGGMENHSAPLETSCSPHQTGSPLIFSSPQTVEQACVQGCVCPAPSFLPSVAGGEGMAHRG